MNAAQVGFGVAAAAALLYGLLLQARPPDWRRTLVKAAFAGSLAVAARFADAPPLLALALGLAALADGALAMEPSQSGAGGFMATLVARVAYMALFFEISAPATLLASPTRLAAVLAVLAVGGLIAAVSLGRHGRLRTPDAILAGVVSMTAVSGLTLTPGFQLVCVGACLLAAADIWRLPRLFRGESLRRLATTAGWWLYVAAQGAIAWGFLQPWRL